MKTAIWNRGQTGFRHSLRHGEATHKAVDGRTKLKTDENAVADAIGQLVLPFTHTPRFAADDFVFSPSNAAARSWLLGPTPWPERRLALWGPAGTGKTHMLDIWVRMHEALLLHGASLSHAHVAGLFAAPVPVMAIALDGADQCGDERALLHLINTAREHGMALLLGARTPPARWPVGLPDLASRLRATMAVAMGQPGDGLLRVLLLRLLAERQIVVAQPVVEWLLRRLPRTARAMQAAVRRLDHAALATGRPVTRALAAHVLSDMLAGSESHAFVPDP
ncbi:HdaA/DnaA family protein [Komagataeibacter medellinensis]|uniref:Chromosomal replication initiator protein DnaA-related protein n=1 Tax=Komagataeibacter medellinensis (strain NBRC 3288 / BCRC 11682 / LMG 1693 / Kondo 51) TaxID=634177 RepID=G2I2W8_KOMMN|nr:chromosomal replication initiator protein DnaA-related protein [Komagataeibacter medellinensis NBRC 3288]